MKRTLFTILMAVNCMVLHAANVAPIIPAPMKAEERDGTFQLTAASRILSDREFKNEARLLAARLHAATSFPLKIKSSAKNSAGDIVLIKAGPETSPGAEGYQLSVTPSNVVIRAATASGIFYGAQSLLQLLPPEIFSTDPCYECGLANSVCRNRGSAAFCMARFYARRQPPFFHREGGRTGSGSDGAL